MATTAGAVPADGKGASSQSGDDARNDKLTTYLSDRGELGDAFRLLRDMQAELKIHFEDDPQLYHAKILDVSADSFLVVDVQPREGLRNLREGREFALSARAPGLYLHSAANRIEQVETERGLPYFRVLLPGRVLYQQRRRATRYTLPPRFAAKGASVLVLRDDGDNRIRGTIIDISVGGLRARFDRPTLPMLARDEEVRVVVDMPNLLEFNCQAVVRHARYDTRSKQLTCGIELTEMHVTDRRRLEQLIESIRKATARRQDTNA